MKISTNWKNRGYGMELRCVSGIIARRNDRAMWVIQMQLWRTKNGWLLRILHFLV